MSALTSQPALSALFLGKDREFSHQMADGLRARCAQGLAVTVTDRLDEGLRLLRQSEFDIIFAEHGAEDAAQGEKGMRRLARLAHGALIVAISPAGSISHAVGALQAGAHDFLVKPFDVDQLASRLHELGQRHGKAKAFEFKRPSKPAGFGGLFGASDQMQALFVQLKKVASSDAPIFITGESGTGKRVCAEAIHLHSAHSALPFVRIDCAAIAPSKLEQTISEAKRGLRDGGILFVDEISHIPLASQACLLQILRDNSNIRMICATGHSPLELVAEKKLREDLFYRLHVLPIQLPPLRQRPADIIPLATHFLAEFARTERKKVPELAQDVTNQLVAREWPGNVRQLRNLMHRLIISFDASVVDSHLLSQVDLENRAASQPHVSAAAGSPNKLVADIAPMWMQERKIIESAITQCNGNIAMAASALEISPSTIYRKRAQWEDMIAKGAVA